MTSFFKKPQNESSDIPIEMAEETLGNVFNACNKVPNTVPLNLLMAEQKNKMRYHFAIRNSSIIAIVFLILSPLAFVRPQFNLATQSIAQNKITMAIEISTLIEPLSVEASINNEPLTLIKQSDSLYLAEITENGEFDVTVTALNHQKNEKSAVISNLK